jgi:hypothetical protein
MQTLTEAAGTIHLLIDLVDKEIFRLVLAHAFSLFVSKTIHTSL